VEAIDPRELSQWLGKVCSRYSIYYHKDRGGSGRLWQERFQTILVQKQGYLSKLGRYIECNPTRAGIPGVQNPWDYLWSSAKSFCFDEVDPLVDKRNCYFWNEMGESDGDRQKVYRVYLLDER
jgi:putative transposase